MLESSRTLKSVWAYCHDVRMDATVNCLKLLDTDGSSYGIATSSGRMLLTDEYPDSRQGRPDEILGSDFSKLESAQILPRTSEITFFMLVTLNLS
jgi:hypothetical protein